MARLLFLLALLPCTCSMVVGGFLKKNLGGRSVGQKQTVADYMATEVMSIPESATLSEAATLLVEKKIRGCPVTSDDGKVVGVLSQFDFLYKAAGRKAPGRASGARSERFVQNVPRWEKMAAQQVSEAMSPNPITVTPDTTMQDAASIILEKKIGRLIVVDDKQELAGILSCTDIMDLVVTGQLDLHKF